MVVTAPPSSFIPTQEEIDAYPGVEKNVRAGQEYRVEDIGSSHGYEEGLVAQSYKHQRILKAGGWGSGGKKTTHFNGHTLYLNHQHQSMFTLQLPRVPKATNLVVVYGRRGRVPFKLLCSRLKVVLWWLLLKRHNSRYSAVTYNGEAIEALGDNEILPADLKGEQFIEIGSADGGVEEEGGGDAMSGVEGSDVAGDGGAADGTGALARVGGTGEPSAGASDALGGGADSDPGDSSVHPHLPVTHHPALKEALEKERSGANSVSGACVHMSKNCSEGSLIASAVGLPTTEEQNRRGILVGPPLTEYEKVRDGNGQFGKAFPSVFWNGVGDPTDDDSHSEKVSSRTGYRHTMKQACSRKLESGDRVAVGEFGSPDLGGFGELHYQALMAPATHNGLCFAMLSELRLQNLFRCTCIFMSKRAEVFKDMDARQFLELLRSDKSILSDMNRSTASQPGFKKNDAKHYFALKNWCAHFAFFEGGLRHVDRRSPRRFACIFGTVTVPLYHAWGFIRLCLMVDGRVREYMTAEPVAQFKIRCQLFSRHFYLGTVYSFEFFEAFSTYEAAVSSVVDSGSATENHQDGRPHRHDVKVHKASGNPCTITEPSHCDDWIPLGVLISWYFDVDDPVASLLRRSVEATSIADDAVAALESRREGLHEHHKLAYWGGGEHSLNDLPLSFVRLLFGDLHYVPELVPGAGSECSCRRPTCVHCTVRPVAVRCLFLVMVVEALTIRKRHIAAPCPGGVGSISITSALCIKDWLELGKLGIHAKVFIVLLVDDTLDLSQLSMVDFLALLDGVDAWWKLAFQDVIVEVAAVPELGTSGRAWLLASYQALVASSHHLLWCDIHWLRARSVPNFNDPASIARSNADFFMDFGFFEDSHVLTHAQREAYASGKSVSSVRNRYLAGETISGAKPGETETFPAALGGKHRDFCPKKAVSTRVVASLIAHTAVICDVSREEAQVLCTGLDHWNENYLYFLMSMDLRADAWHHVRDRNGSPIRGAVSLPTWSGFVSMQAACATESDKCLWDMVQHLTGSGYRDGACNEGVALSTRAQRELFIEIYGIEMFWSMVQPPCQTHTCSAYCCKPTKRKVVAEDGTVSYPVTNGSCRFNFHCKNGYGRTLRPSFKKDPKLVAVYEPKRNAKELTECDAKYGVATLANSNNRAVNHLSGLVYYTLGYMCKQGRHSQDFKELVSALKKPDAAVNPSSSALGVLYKMYHDAGGAVEVSRHGAVQVVMGYYQYKTSRDSVTLYDLDVAGGVVLNTRALAAVRLAEAAAGGGGTGGGSDTCPVVDGDGGGEVGDEGVEEAGGAGSVDVAPSSWYFKNKLCLYVRWLLCSASSFVRKSGTTLSEYLVLHDVSVLKGQLRSVVRADKWGGGTAAPGTIRYKATQPRVLSVCGAEREMNPNSPLWCRHELMLNTDWKEYVEFCSASRDASDLCEERWRNLWPLPSGDTDALGIDYVTEWKRWLLLMLSKTEGGSAAVETERWDTLSSEELLRLAEDARLLSAACGSAMLQRQSKYMRSLSVEGSTPFPNDLRVVPDEEEDPFGSGVDGIDWDGALALGVEPLDKGLERREANVTSPAQFDSMCRWVSMQAKLHTEGLLTLNRTPARVFYWSELNCMQQIGVWLARSVKPALVAVERGAAAADLRSWFHQSRNLWWGEGGSGKSAMVVHLDHFWGLDNGSGDSHVDDLKRVRSVFHEGGSSSMGTPTDLGEGDLRKCLYGRSPPVKRVAKVGSFSFVVFDSWC
jgi:hypothetical protein